MSCITEKLFEVSSFCEVLVTSSSSTCSVPMFGSASVIFTFFIRDQNSFVFLTSLKVLHQYSASTFLSSLVTRFCSLRYSVQSSLLFLFVYQFKVLYFLFISFLMSVVTQGNDFLLTIAFLSGIFSLIISLYNNSHALTQS